VEDETNQLATYGSRNAIRAIVENQEDMPVALRKESILDVEAKGTVFRTQLLEKVNDLLRQCRIEEEKFLGTIRVKIPLSVTRERERYLRHLLAALARLVAPLTPDVARYDFQGNKEDAVSPTIVDNIRHPFLHQFNFHHASFKKFGSIHNDRVTYTIIPEYPRMKGLEQWSPRLRLTPVSDSPHGKFRGSFNAGSLLKTVEVFVETLRDYYLRRLNHEDIRVLEAVVPWNRSVEWHTGVRRMKAGGYSPKQLHLVCHKEGDVDSLPQFRFDFSPDVKTFYNRSFDLSQLEEWEGLEWK
jgi:hypothetical protein